MKDIAKRWESAAYSVLVVASLATILHSMSSVVEWPSGEKLIAALTLRVHAAETNRMHLTRDCASADCPAKF